MSTTSAAAAADELVAEIRTRVVPWLQTREGIASASLGALVLWILWAPVSAPLATGLLGGACAIVAVALGARVWESSTAPRPPSFSRARGAGDGDPVLQRDPNAGFWRDNRGFLWDGRVWFAGTGCPPLRLRLDTYRRLRALYEQSDRPVFVARARGRQWWWWRDAFYSDSGDHGPEDLGPLLTLVEREDEQGLKWELTLRPANPIPDGVKRVVSERDGGRCVSCGRREVLRFARVVPRTLGGGNDPGNLRLLCGGCGVGRERTVADPGESPRAGRTLTKGR